MNQLLTDKAYTAPSRLLTRTEMQFYSLTLDEREAVALAKVCPLPVDATYQQIEDAVLRCFTQALEASGLKDTIEYVGGQRRDHLRDKELARLRC
jgi:hypothetical protein